MIRNNEINDNRLKTNDNGNSIKMIYEHPFANKINFFFLTYLVDRFLVWNHFEK